MRHPQSSPSLLHNPHLHVRREHAAGRPLRLRLLLHGRRRGRVPIFLGCGLGGLPLFPARAQAGGCTSEHGGWVSRHGRAIVRAASRRARLLLDACMTHLFRWFLVSFPLPGFPFTEAAAASSASTMIDRPTPSTTATGRRPPSPPYMYTQPSGPAALLRKRGKKLGVDRKDRSPSSDRRSSHHRRRQPAPPL